MLSVFFNGPLSLTFTFAPIFNFLVRSYHTANTVRFIGDLFQLHASLRYVNRKKIQLIEIVSE